MSNGPQAPNSATAPAPQDQQPVGQGDYVVKQGDCMSSIAKSTGHFWETIWNDGANAQLKAVRKDPNVLLPGDRVTIPPIQPKQESGNTEMRHRFVRKGEPAQFNIRCLRNGRPMACQPYTLKIDGKEYEGSTDASGFVRCAIPPDAKAGELRVGPEDKQSVYNLKLGHLDPVDSIGGVQGRLKNLGLYQGEIDGQFGPRTQGALKAFQQIKKMPITGQMDGNTLAALQQEMGA